MRKAKTSAEKDFLTSNFDISIVAIFISILLISNIASTKLFSVMDTNIIIDGGTILFPFAYIIGDIITEVYGFKRAKFSIYLGFVSMALLSVVLFIVQLLPPAVGWDNQSAYESILGLIPRIAIGSWVAYLAGEVTNSYLMDRIKQLTKGRHFWIRAIGSTIVGALIDTSLFSVIAFAGVIDIGNLISLIITVYAIKVLIEILVLPITYTIVTYVNKTKLNRMKGMVS